MEARLDEILEWLIVPDSLVIRDSRRKQVRAAIVEAVEGLIGEDDMELNTDNPVKNARPFYRNKFRAELRKAIKEWQ